MIYLDSSALLKLIHSEPESAALQSWLTARPHIPVVSTELARVEVIRACRRVNVEALSRARVLLAQLDLIAIAGDVVDEAAEVGDPWLRSLDAIHLASALSIRPDLSAFVTYDRRLAEAAFAARLTSVQPGA